MGKIFGIENLPVAKPFPSLTYGAEYCLKPPEETHTHFQQPVDTFVKKVKNENWVKKVFKRIGHKA